MKYVGSIVSILLFCLPSGLISQSEDGGGAVLAKAGNVFISEREFLDRFELTPGLYRHRKPQLEGEKLQFLYSLVAEKLLAQEAVARRLDQDSGFQESFQDLVQKIARDELYRREVKAKVRVSPAELSQGIRNSLKIPFVKYLFFPEEDDARNVRSQVKTAEDFDRVIIDSSIDFVRDTASVLWGEADSAIEAAAYTLSIGRVSPIIHTGDGYYILKLLRRNQNAFYAGMQPNDLRERVLEKIRSRKEKRRMGDFVRAFLRSENGYSPPTVFKKFEHSISGVFHAHEGDAQTTLTDALRTELMDSCQSILSDILIVAGARVWSVREAIDRLYQQSFAVPNGEINTMAHRLFTEFQSWVNWELLEREALRRGLDTVASVWNQLQPWRDEFLATMMKNDLFRSITVSRQDVDDFVSRNDTDVVLPEVKLRLLRTSSLDSMQEAINDLEHGMGFEEVVRRWSSYPALRAARGIVGPFPINQERPLGEIAWNMKVGQQYGPVQDSSGGFAFFELLEKRRTRMHEEGDDSLRFVQARSEVFRVKQHTVLNEFLAKVAEERGFTVYQDRLAKLHVTAIPMLTYRFLGFGGRMFAVPFVDKQIDWLNVESPLSRINP